MLTFSIQRTARSSEKRKLLAAGLFSDQHRLSRLWQTHLGVLVVKAIPMLMFWAHLLELICRPPARARQDVSWLVWVYFLSYTFGS